MISPAAAVIAARVPVQLDRREARAAARRELARPEYQADRPGLLERVVTWLREQISELLDQAAAAAPGGWFGLAMLVCLIIGAVVAVRLQVGRLARSRRADAALFDGRERSSASHRAAADAAAAAGNWAEAIRERLRAVIRSAEERGLLDPRPGRTADEAAREVGAALPDHAEPLRAAARVFDEVRYGGRAATPAHDCALRDVDAKLLAAGVPAGPAARWAGRAGSGTGAAP